MIALSALPDLQTQLAPPGTRVSPVRAMVLVSILGLFGGAGSALCGWCSRNGSRRSACRWVPRG